MTKTFYGLVGLATAALISCAASAKSLEACIAQVISRF